MRRLAVGLFAVLLLSVQSWDVRANEYFADGEMYLLGDGIYIGIIDAWGLYAIYGNAEQCNIVPIYSPVGDAVAVDCRIVTNKAGGKFSGWINFRGHPRPFCGTKTGELPVKCFGGYDG